MVLYQKIDDVSYAGQLADFEYHSWNMNSNENQLSFSSVAFKPSLSKLESFWTKALKDRGIEIIAATFKDRVVGLIAIKFKPGYSGEIIKMVGINDHEVLSNLIKKAEIFLASHNVFKVSLKTFNPAFFEEIGYKVDQPGIRSGRSSGHSSRSDSFDSDVVSLKKRLGISLVV